MRTPPFLLLLVGLAPLACNESGGSSPHLTGARITTTTTGLDLDPNGYRGTVDGTDRGPIPANDLVRV